MEKMQRDAVNRVNEMHRRASQMVNPQPQPTPTAPPPRPAPPPTENHRNPFSPQPPKHMENDLISSLSRLWDFKIDEEKALIGIIIYILSKNNADPKLLLGLGYLLL
ncbi:MAG: hypothetical protein E7509_03810 [Ruminococcus sp.]|nr:hypothetical protein [Ruminococcus sp.]